METSHFVPPVLLLPKSGPCLSLYFHLSHADRHADKIRLKNLAAHAEGLLGKWNPPLGEEHSFALMQPLWRLFGTNTFWQDRRSNRAVFLAPGFFTELFLPHHVDDTVCVSSEFLIRPLLAPPAGGTFTVLALHRDRVRLFEANEHGMQPIPLTLPTFDKACTYDFSTGKHRLDHATVITCDHSHPRGSGDIEHAHTKAYYSIIVKLLHAEYPHARGPMMLVGTHRNVAQFQSVANKLVDSDMRILAKDPDSMSIADLERQVLEVAQPYLRGDSEASLRSLHERSENVPLERELTSIIESAQKGQIETLWIARGAQAWGKIEATGTPDIHPSANPWDEDLLNMAALQVLRHRGQAYEVEAGQLEPGTKAIASLRYLTDRYQADVPIVAIVNGHGS